MTKDLIANIQTYLAKHSLPGAEAHLTMTPYRRLTPKIPDDRREGAVLLLLYRKKGEWYFPLTQRHEYNGVHSKQISFPRGKIEQEDASIYAAATRETREEIGVAEQLITKVADLSHLYIPPSNFMVHPFIGVLNNAPVFIKDEVEVAKIIEVKLLDLLTETNERETTVVAQGGIKLKTPCFYLDNKVVWGATAAILAEFKTIIKEIEQIAKN